MLHPRHLVPALGVLGSAVVVAACGPGRLDCAPGAQCDAGACADWGCGADAPADGRPAEVAPGDGPPRDYRPTEVPPRLEVWHRGGLMTACDGHLRAPRTFTGW